MRITNVRVRTEAWPLAGTGAARGRTERTSLVVEVETAGGHVGRGEAAPLPGFSPDTLDAAGAGLAALVARVPLELEVPLAGTGQLPLPGTLGAAGAASPALAVIADLAADLTSSPSARFAIETALLDAIARTSGVALDALLGAPAGSPVSTAIVVDTPDDARRAAVRGATCLKIKVGPGDDLDRVRAIHAAAPAASLRLDANRTWSREDTPARLAALAGLPVALVEEPCPDAYGLLTSALGVPLALDESLVSLAPAELDAALASPGLAALVLKPTLLGGFRACLELAARARAAGKLAIVSHTLEGAIGRAACHALARAVGDGPHGLGGDVPPPADTPPRAGAGFARGAGRGLLLAVPRWETVEAIREALAARRPIAMLHPKLPADELARQRAIVERATLPTDTAVVLFTSGSTGPARGVVLSRAALEAAAAASEAHLGWKDDDRWLLALSTAHAGGLAVVVRCTLAGKPIVMVEGDFDRARCARLLEECTLASLVPTQLLALLEDPAWRPPRSLRAVLLGGAAAPPSLLRQAADRGVPFLTSYGLTETFGQIATAPLPHAGDPDAPLVPLAGVQLDAGTRDEPQRIRVRGPTLATAYLDGHGALQPIAPELATADLGFVERGALHVVGRADDVIVSGGEKVHPTVVEAALTATPGVRAACAFAVPDPRWGHIVGAALVVDATFDEARAAAHWHARLPPHARPRQVALLDTLPLGPTGKVDRRRAALAERRPVRYPR